MTYRFTQYSSQRQGLIIQPFRSSRLILHSRSLDQTQILTVFPLTCSDPWGSSQLRAGLLIRRRTIPNAILSLKPGAKLHRPIQRSPIANLLVAGAWTDTGWPPNLESAIVSGNRCADAIAREKS